MIPPEEDLIELVESLDISLLPTVCINKNKSCEVSNLIVIDTNCKYRSCKISWFELGYEPQLQMKLLKFYVKTVFNNSVIPKY